MNWILGAIGALFGIALSDNRGLLGAVVGFFALFGIGALSKLRNRLDKVERELNAARTRIAAQVPRADPSERAETAAAEPIAPAAAAPAPTDATPIATAPIAATMAQASVSQPEGGSEPPPLPATAPVAPMTRDPIERVPAEPDWMQKLIARIKAWFTEGNVPVKVGVLVLFVGVAAALRYAAIQGYLNVPIEVRLALIAAGGVVALVFGWRERVRRPAFGLSLQGGALGVLLLTVFTTYSKYHLIPPMAAFVLVVVLVAGAALLAVLQDAIALAALGFIGGYLAPVLISTGSNNPVGLFSYYAVLNAAVFAVSWKRSWRLLNLIGFAFTFGVGTAWGTKFYRPELFASVEPFLILFFVFYVVIGLLYVIRQTTHRRPWVDGTLVFGTPLLAFPLQAGLLKDDRMALAFSALVVAVVYAGLVYWLRRKRDERLLTEAYGALALGFATLAVPLAFSAGTTASVWALEGAGIAWLGIRQNRAFPWLTGLGLQLLAAGAYLIGQIDFSPHAPSHMLLLNPAWLGAAIIAFAGYVLGLIHDRMRPIPLLPLVLFVWATAWWLIAALTQFEIANTVGVGAWRFALGYFAGTIAVAAILRARLPWPRLDWLVAVSALIALCMSFSFDPSIGGPLAPDRLVVCAAYAAAIVWSLWSTRVESSRVLAATHLLWLWTIAAVTMMQSRHLALDQQLAVGWLYTAQFAPLALLTLGFWRKPELFAWPRGPLFDGYRIGWFAPASALLAIAFAAGLFVEGSAAPLAYLPLLNPLELLLVAIGALLYALCPESLHGLRRIWPYAGFALATSATLRAVHHWHGEPWSDAVFDSAMSQMALTVVWSLLGVGSWIIGSRRGDRRLWMGGALLMGVVLLKLVVLDRHYMGNMPGIVSFMVVGLLLVGVGYIAPSPPKPGVVERAEGAPGETNKKDEVEST
jgi:uncharacterized membrane protein